MSIWKAFRILYLRSTDYTHGYQESGAAQLLKFYRLWAPFYDLSVRLDPAYLRQLKNMVDSTVRPGDMTIDIGCGTGLSAIYAASIAKMVTGVDPSHNMLAKLAKKIRKRNIKNIEIELRRPACIFNNGNVAISRRIAERWRLIGAGIVG